MCSNVKIITTRETYDLLEWLGDVGGFQGIIYTFFGLLFSRFSAMKLDSLLANRFYKWSPPDSWDINTHYSVMREDKETIANK